MQEELMHGPLDGKPVRVVRCALLRLCGGTAWPGTSLAKVGKYLRYLRSIRNIWEVLCPSSVKTMERYTHAAVNRKPSSPLDDL